MVFASSVELSLSPLIVCPQYRLSFHLAKNECQNIDDHILAQQVIGKRRWNVKYHLLKLCER